MHEHKMEMQKLYQVYFKLWHFVGGLFWGKVLDHASVVLDVSFLSDVFPIHVRDSNSEFFAIFPLDGLI